MSIYMALDVDLRSCSLSRSTPHGEKREKRKKAKTRQNSGERRPGKKGKKSLSSYSELTAAGPAQQPPASRVTKHGIFGILL